MKPDYWDQACKDLSRADPVMKKLIKSYKGETLKARGDAFYTLARSIVGQQISVKAADSVWNRLETLLLPVGEGWDEGPHKITSSHPPTYTSASVPRREGIVFCIIKLTDEQLRASGLSGQKVKYLREIGAFFEAHQWQPVWAEDDKALIKQLTSIKGVGRWTAEMFMIFHLLRPNVFPDGDLGLLKSIYLQYNKGQPLPKTEVLELAQNWNPWQTVATWYLWRALDPLPVEY